MNSHFFAPYSNTVNDTNTRVITDISNFKRYLKN